MNIIPVIDLLDAQVVHARQGQRECYQPIRTPLCSGSHPFDVIQAMLSLASFTTVYIADLNALMHTGNNVAIIQQIRLRFPDVNFWVDAGFPVSVPVSMTPVIGSESLTADTVPKLNDLQRPFILSLDFSASQQFIGPKLLLERLEYWPQTLIVMSLSHVGVDKGPDYERITEFCQQHRSRQWVAAGGVRNNDDLARLQQRGASAVLVASALHAGRLSLENFVLQTGFQCKTNDEQQHQDGVKQVMLGHK